MTLVRKNLRPIMCVRNNFKVNSHDIRADGIKYVTILTSRRKGNGGQTAISTLVPSTDAVSSASSVARATAEPRSVFIFQFPATRGILPPSMERSPLREKDGCFIDTKALLTESKATTKMEIVVKAVMLQDIWRNETTKEGI